MVEDSAETADPIVIKKYANRRLYNTVNASFVTLDDLHKMVKDGRSFIVHDAKSARDITSSVLTQIIAEQESKGHNVLPDKYLRQMIKAYSDGVGPQLATFLEQSMAVFATHQKNAMRQMHSMLDSPSVIEQTAKVSRQNLEEFQRYFGLFSGPDPGKAPEPAAENQDDDASRELEIRELKERLTLMGEQLDALLSTDRSRKPEKR
jgi:polyhydroxyalkanoate synthesis repressor PhaR